MSKIVDKDIKNWKWVDDQVDAIIKYLDKIDFEPLLITGVPRGGLIAAVMLSHKLGIDYAPLTTCKMLPKKLRKKTLVVDDIVDSGVTALKLADEDFTIASLCFRTTSKYKPFAYGEKISKDDWIVFPWEIEESETIQDYLAS